MASEKKINRGKSVTKKISPKLENAKPELKLLFEKLRKKKEREAESIIFDERKKEKTSLDEKKIVEKETRNKVCESGLGPDIARNSLFGAGPRQDSRGERQKSVRDLINTLEKNINEKDEKKPTISTRKSPNVKEILGKRSIYLK